MPCFFIYRTALSEGFEGERVKAEREVANAADNNAIAWRY